MRLVAGKSAAEIHRGGRTPLEGYHPSEDRPRPAARSTLPRIHARIDAMIQRAGSKKSRSSSKTEFPQTRSRSNLSATRDWREYLERKLTKTAALHKIQQATRRFAKRQLTWFRREPDVHWLAGFGDAPEISRAAFEILESANFLREFSPAKLDARTAVGYRAASYR